MSDVKIFNATKEEVKYIDEGIITYNQTQLPFTQEPTFIPLNRCIKEDGKVVAGILATIACWGILSIDVLWVKEEYRGKGYGSQLMKAVEEEAKGKGAKLSRVETFEFQAKGFYEKLGYEVFGVLENCPEGYKDYSLAKRLD